MLEGIEVILFDLGGTLKHSPRWEWYDDTLPTLQRLHNQHRLIIAANQPYDARPFIEGSLVNRYLEKIFLSDELGKEKPNREFYQAILQRLPGVPAERVAMVGDDLENDIACTKPLGIRGIWLKRGDGFARAQASGFVAELVQPDYVIHSLEELR